MSVPRSLVLLVVLSLPRVAPAEAAGGVTGRVKDVTGAVVPGAQVVARNAQQAVSGSATTDREGAFAFPDLAPGTYMIEAARAGLATRREPVALGRNGGVEVELVLDPMAVSEEVTVTADAGRVQSVQGVAPAVNVVDQDEVWQRAKAVVAQASTEEVGIHLQRTSPTMAGIFVRGLTGNKVSVFVDGIRYSTSAARGGVNTFLDLVEPSTLQALEVLRGPTGAQYGSDAIGGSVQFLTRAPSFAADGSRVRGSWATSFNSADLSFGSSLDASYASRSFGILASGSGRRINTLRPGDGRDSHNAVTRFLGLSSDVVIGDRLPDTAFTQYGGLLKANWAPDPSSQLVMSYTRSQQDGGKRYDQLLGGDGNLVAELRNLMLDRFYLKYDRTGLGFLDHATLSYSFNSQREERVNQGGNGNPRAAVNHEYERTGVHGVQAYASKVLGRHELAWGGDLYREQVRAPSFGFNPVTGAVTDRRPRVPDDARYVSGGAYLQDVFEAIPGRLRLSGNVRYTAASYRSRAADSPLVNGQPLWPNDSLHASSVTFRVGGRLDVVGDLSLSANVGRGFRAPHITDLGTLGLTGSGFEVAAPDVAGLGATVGTTADTRAVSTGLPVDQVGPETSLSYEMGLRYQGTRVRSELVLFRNDVSDNIVKQALILPGGAVGRALGDQLITRQTADGVVFVAVSSSPVLVRVNLDDARIWGVEHTLELRLGSAWTVRTLATYLHAEDRRTGLPPNIEGGTPAPDGYLKVRYAPAGGRFWVEPYVHAAARQERLSTLDLEDRRTGATRSRTSIAGFFTNGARVRGLVGAGPDSLPGTADDVLLATGERLSQVQDRVLGAGVTSAPLFTALPGYVTLNLRGGVRFAERHEILVDLENLGDRNYRGISWGLDAPGRGVYLAYRTRF